MKNLFNQPNSTYQKYAEALQAKSVSQKAWVLFNYLLPGILITILINIKRIHDFFIDLFSCSSESYQFWLLIALTFGWHITYPVFMLRIKKGYSWKETAEALSLNRFSVKGFLVTTPLFFLLLLLLAVPYMGAFFPSIHAYLQSIDLIAIPEHSLFYDYQTIYNFAPWQLALLFIGNFVGEEIYFRGYLLKRSSFLGKHNWWIHSLLFTIYHLWQIPMTYALGFISLSFGIYMIWRKNLYELMLLHVLINLLLPVAVQIIWY